MSRADAARVLGPSVRDLGDRAVRCLGVMSKEISGPIAADLIAALVPMAKPSPEQAVEILRSMLQVIDEAKDHEAVRALWAHLAQHRRAAPCRLDLLEPTEDPPTEPPASPSRKAA